ncbi:UNVERIFIED_ASMBLY: helicase-primase helicase subunit [human gammaherpesvirus 4]|nr:helicase-primase helicase subunit [human gammaherpesvirus 4]
MAEEPRAPEALSSTFMLNMTSDASVRCIVRRIGTLAKRRVQQLPDMETFSPEFDPELSEPPFLPFSAYVITGTAGAGKSTSVSCLHHTMDCLVTGATTVAAQNLSQTLRAYCPTVYSAFGFKSRHINMTQRVSSHGRSTDAALEELQRRDLAKYWPVLSDIAAEFRRTKPRGLYSGVSGPAFEVLRDMHQGQLWTTNVIVVDEAGTLSVHILTAVVFCYWFFNAWLRTPLYRRGRIPCIVCVGSPTQTDAFQSSFSHETQVNKIRECDNILTFLVGNPRAATYVDVARNWALFINNKRCTDVQFGHLMKTLEYGLELSPDILAYVDRFVVPRAAIMDPTQYVGWTRLFLSHAEVKTFLTTLQATLKTAGQGRAARGTGGDGGGVTMFTCPVECEVFLDPLAQYKTLVGLPGLTAHTWLQKNYARLGNYSQFADQDMVPVGTEQDEERVKVTYNVTYVKHSSVSVNCKTKKSICGYTGTFGDFMDTLEADSFVEAHGHEQPEYVYSFLARLIYGGIYAFSHGGHSLCENGEYVAELGAVPLPGRTWDPEVTAGMELGELPLEVAWDGERSPAAVFYARVLAPPAANSAPLCSLLNIYNDLRAYFRQCLDVAVRYGGREFRDLPFCTFTNNMLIRDNIEFTSDEPLLHGLLDYASTTENYTLLGYTHLNVFFGIRGKQQPQDAGSSRMPRLMVKDEAGFVCCLEHNTNKLYETIEDKSLNLCSIRDYGISSKLAMTIAKAQGLSLNKVAICFGSHRNIKPGHVYVALSRARHSNCVVMDRNPLSEMITGEGNPASGYIVDALKNSRALLVY